jgi:hypothetical protein
VAQAGLYLYNVCREALLEDFERCEGRFSCAYKAESDVESAPSIASGFRAYDRACTVP